MRVHVRKLCLLIEHRVAKLRPPIWHDVRKLSLPIEHVVLSMLQGISAYQVSKVSTVGSSAS